MVSYPLTARALWALSLFTLIIGAQPDEVRAQSDAPAFFGATGGILRFPNSQQSQDEGNAFGEAWVKLGARIHKSEKGELSAFVLGNFVADTLDLSYNNTGKIGVGIGYSYQVNDKLNLTLSARHDWYAERFTDERRSGMRYALDYYYYQYNPGEAGETFWGLPKQATIFKSYGTLAYPGSLVDGDENVVLTLGGEYSADLRMPDTDWLLTPYVDFDFAWDADGNNYNNKIIPGAGVKVRLPIKNGEIFAGARVQADYRWVDDTLDAGPGIFFGWYKGF